MIRKMILTALCVLPALLQLSCGTGATSPGGGDQPPEETPITIAPYDILRHGYDLEGVWACGPGSVTVGERGFAFVTTAAGRYLLPTSVQADLGDVYVTGGGVVVVACGKDDRTNGRVTWYENGFRSYLPLGGSPVAISPSLSGVDEWPLFVLEETGLVSAFTRAGLDPVGNLDAFRSYDVWAYSGTMLWVATLNGLALGGPDEVFNLVLEDGRYDAVSGVGVDSVMAVGGPPGACRIHRMAGGDDFHTVYDSPENLWDLCWLDAEFAVAVGEDGVAVTYDGAGWSPGSVDPPVSLRGVTAWREADQPRALAVGDSGGVYAYADGRWTGGHATKLTCRNLTGLSPDLMFALEGGDLMKFDGSWHRQPPAGDLALGDVFCVAEDEVWALGEFDIDPYVVRFDGEDWSFHVLSSLDGPNDLWVSDDGTVFVACDFGTVISNRAGVFTPMSAAQPMQHLNAVWGTSANSVYAAGVGGALVHWNGQQWAAMASGTADTLVALHGSSDENIVAVGAEGTVIRYDGVSWETMDTEGLTYHPPEMVWCGGPDDVWLANGRGEIIHYDGAGWAELDSPFSGHWHGLEHTGLWGCEEGLYLIAENDVMLRYRQPPTDLLSGLAGPADPR